LIPFLFEVVSTAVTLVIVVAVSESFLLVFDATIVLQIKKPA
jgi:hypothetical protein